MFCHKCGVSLPDTAKFCNKCGVAQNGIAKPAAIEESSHQVEHLAATTETTTPAESGMSRTLIGVVVLLVICAVGFYWYTKSTTSTATQNVGVAVKPVAEIASAPASAIEQVQNNPKEEVSAVAITNTEEKINPSFDCTKASNNLEKMICSDPELSRIDVQLNDVYLSLREKVADKAALKKDQIQWMKNARLCTDKECVLKTYKQRISELSSAN
jgi:uncharacterized protein YecT (DUF1311 family)